MKHGVKRVRQSKEALELKKQKEQAKIKEYLALTSEVLSRKKTKEFSPDTLELTSRLLRTNPEFYTVWNYRRNLLLNEIFPKCTPEEINNVLLQDLNMTTSALKTHPKIYWIWNHRKWCLENTPFGPDDNPFVWRKANWDRELYVIEKVLDADPRNFHAWNYRRYVLESTPTPKPETTELDYTTRKIEANFSNFSAWHQRSKVLKRLWEAGKLDEAKTREEEFELVRNAMYTDPNDQSVWMYHRWLIGSGDDPDVLEREIGVIQELLDEQPDSKWCMESLVHYKRLLLRNRSDEMKSKTLAECEGLLTKLKELDPARRQRYQDIRLELQGTCG